MSLPATPAFEFSLRSKVLTHPPSGNGTRDLQRCSSFNPQSSISTNGRGGGIRTHGLFVPNEYII